MAVEFANALGAYNAAVDRITEKAAGTASSDSVAGVPGNDFSSMVKNFAESAVNTGKVSEQMTAAAAAGKADLNQVVVAVAEAEVTLNTVVAVRDKVIAAYKEILRMPM